MDKKFELIADQKIEVFGRTLYRIRALISFGVVEIGDIGGYVEGEGNLSQNGEAWVSGEAQVFGEARVSGEARVFGKAQVSGEARVFGEAQVSGKAQVSGEAQVFGEARVFGKAQVFGEAQVFGVEHVLVIGPIGSRHDHTTFFRDKDNEITVKCGCFLGKIDRFLQKVTETHGDNKHAQVYHLAVSLAKIQIGLTEELMDE